MPCRWMDETTFADPQVLSYLRDNYVSIKIDIDDFDGFALKQQYDVQTLPTLLFFSSDGRQLSRVGEGIGAAELLDKLRELDRPANRPVLGGAAPAEDWSEPFAHMTNAYAEAERYTAPAEYVAAQRPAATAGAPPLPRDVRAESAVPAAPEAIAGDVTVAHPPTRAAMSVPAIETRRVEATLLSASAGTAALRIEELEYVAPAEDPVAADGVADAEATAPAMSPANVRLFSLQAGVFRNRDNAMRAADHLRDYTERPVLVEVDRIDEAPVYRLYVGHFTDMRDATEVGKQLYIHGFSCIPKELAMR